jgi:ribosomal protein S18 acetylase RimI-like enzyme
MPTVTYRAATPDDAAALAALRWENQAERHPELQPRDTLAEYTAVYIEQVRDELARGIHRAWLAEADGEVVASVALVWWVMPPNPDEHQRRRGFVTSVYTRPAYRRQGVARQLMTMLIEHARAEGLQRLILWSSEMGRPLYEDLGFTPSRGLEIDL